MIKKSHGRSQRSLADEFNVGKTQVSNVLKRKAEYIAAWEDNEGNGRKCLCTGTEYEDVNSVTWEWFHKTRSASIPVSGPMTIRLSRDPAVWSSFVNEGTNHIVNRAVTRGNVGRGSKKTGLGRVDFSSVFGEMGGG